jgi:hypothetical protein
MACTNGFHCQAATWLAGNMGWLSAEHLDASDSLVKSLVHAMHFSQTLA